MTRDSELNDAYGLIVDLKADRVQLETRIQAAQTLDYGQFHSIRDYRDAVLAALAASLSPHLDPK